MRLPVFLVFILVIASCAAKKESDDVVSSEDEIPSPRREAEGIANGVQVVVDYGSPAVKGRKIWGGLEKFDRVWRAGANETTTITIDKNATINGDPLDEGKYALFIIPRENDDWVIIFNTDWDEWGAFRYNQENDVLRVFVAPSWVEENQERLEYAVEEGQLKIRWEKVQLAMDIAQAQ